MKILLMAVGATRTPIFRQGIDEYLSRLRHYIPLEVKIIDDVKISRSATHEQQKQAEGRAILRALSPSDHLILLDERGARMTSRRFADSVAALMNSGAKQAVYAIGGPFGFSDEVYARANAKLSLSDMTFSHEMVRLFFAEQLYRAFTIIRGESYHHD